MYKKRQLISCSGMYPQGRPVRPLLHPSATDINVKMSKTKCDEVTELAFYLVEDWLM